jgi:hypothetical protein
MNDRQASVVAALQRVYGETNMTTLEDDNGVVHVMTHNALGLVTMSLEIYPEQDPDRPDVGDRVAFQVGGQTRYGLLVMYRDVDDGIAIVPDGERNMIWEHVGGVEIVLPKD